MRYWKDIEFKDERGAIIIDRLTMDTEDPSVCNEQYLGKGMTVLNSPMGEFPIEFEVELEADSIGDAFEVFEEEMGKKAQAAAEEKAQEAMAQIKERMQEEQGGIITPDQIRQSAKFNPNMRG